MSDTAVFHAYVRNDLLPSVAEITRAMSSRGFKDGGFDALRAGLGEHYDQGTYKEVLRQMEMRLSFEGDANWCRELARTVALLGAGAFENPGNQKLLFYGR